ncbi:hypothetical protein [Polyangium sorediatum]|uniref:Uncharacterized protein n=1 Tax=Polyangium sorediatum TaxID=889274 RepID=A0ABT6P493_9BACT|nr:hypothetical protein [Polyangium sorediatum]MDI1435346.1 hypothetical protein [Polyangium sorediatum]
MKETFSAALRAEIEAIVMRYEALVSSRVEAAEREGARGTEAAERELATLRASLDGMAQELAALRSERDTLARELAALRSERDGIAAQFEASRGRVESLEAEVRAGAAVASALEEQFSAEKRFVVACADVSGTMMESALCAALGRDLSASPALYAALKAKGLEGVLVGAFKERGRAIAHAPLLERERAPLAALASAAGCELVTPTAGTRFSASSMEKAATTSDPAEEGNVVECMLPGLRRAGTEGMLVFPRVRVATG